MRIDAFGPFSTSEFAAGNRTIFRYEALPGPKVNGQLTLDENSADLAGLAIAYDAYQMSLSGKPAP